MHDEDPHKCATDIEDNKLADYVDDRCGLDGDTDAEPWADDSGSEVENDDV